MAQKAQAKPAPVAGVDFHYPVAVTGIVGHTLVANPTDVIYVTLQNYGRPARLRHFRVEGVATADGKVDVLLQRSGDGGVGTSAPMATGFIDSFDGNAAGPISALALTANRSAGGNGVTSGTRPIIRSGRLTYETSTTPGKEFSHSWEPKDTKAPILRNLAEAIVINFLGNAQPTGAKITVHMEFDVPRLVRICFSGDSTFSNAITGLLNGGANAGGVGKAGLLNEVATIENYGDNGKRLYDFIMNNGMTFPLQTVLARSFDILVLGWGINDYRTGLASDNQLIAMLDTVIYVAKNGAALNQVVISPKATVHTITAISWSGSVVTVTVAAGHGFQVGATANVQISGCTPSQYNIYAAITVTSATQFTYPLASNPGAATVLGTAQYAMKMPAAMTANPDMRIILWGPTGFTADDAGDGPFFYLSAAGNTTLSGRYTGLTLAQAALSASATGRAMCAAFAGDVGRQVKVVQRQDIKVDNPAGGARVPAFPTSSAVDTNANTPTVGTLASTMKNQIHGNTRGELEMARQIWPILRNAVREVLDRFAF